MESKSVARSIVAQAWVWCLPPVMIVVMALLAPSARAPWEGVSAAPERREPGRLVLVILDSLRREAVDAHMPSLEAWSRRPGTLDRDVLTCAANATLPCVQTLMEGRERAFSEGLHNFTGRPGGRDSVAGKVEAAGGRVAMFSDLTLDSLYGEQVERSVDVEDWDIPILDRDARVLREAEAVLRARAHDAVIVHVVGTDKVAHRKNPGHPDYAAHFAAVDVALAELLAAAGPRDHVVVTGDHGHDEEGHHTRASVLYAQSPILGDVMRAHADEPGALTQHEVTYLMWLALGLPANVDYAGRYFGVEGVEGVEFSGEVGAHVWRFEALQGRVLERAGFRAGGLMGQVRAKRSAQRWVPVEGFARHAPMIVVYLWWVLWMVGARGRAGWARLGAACLANVVALWASAWAPAWAMGLAAAALVVAMVRDLGGAGGVDGRAVGWMVGLVGAAAVAAAWAPTWEWVGYDALFLVVLVACGAAGSRWRVGSWGGYLPEAIGSVCLIALASGVSFHQFGQNILRGLVLGAVVWAAGRWVNEPRRAGEWARGLARREVLAVGSLCVCGVLVVVQGASGARWWFGLSRALEHAPGFVSVGVYVSGAALSWVMLSEGRRPGFLAFVAVLGAPLVYSGAFGGLPWPVLAGSIVPFVFACAWGRVGGRGGLGGERAGWWMLALSLATCWVALSGFGVERIDYRFSYAYLGGLGRAADVAFWSTWLTAAKYVLPAWTWLFAVYWARADTGTWLEGMRWFWVFLNLKCVALVVQVFVGQALTGQAVDVVTASDLLFTIGCGVLAAMGMSLLALSERS